MGRYLSILAGFLLVLLLAALGVTLTWPWLLAENYRLTNLQLSLTWLAEAAALLWFLYFAIRYAFTWELESAFSESISGVNSSQWIALVVAVAFIVDLGATFVFNAQDGKARREAVPGVCRIEKVKKYSVKEVGDFDSRSLVFTAFSWCTLIDEEGGEQPVYYYGKSSRYSDAAKSKIERNELPADMEIVYDPAFPRRFWVPEAVGDSWNGWRFSQEVTIFALVFSLVVLIFNQVMLQTSVPLEICPMLGITLRFLLAGLDMWFNGQTTIPPL